MAFVDKKSSIVATNLVAVNDYRRSVGRLRFKDTTKILSLSAIVTMAQRPLHVLLHFIKITSNHQGSTNVNAQSRALQPSPTENQFSFVPFESIVVL